MPKKGSGGGGIDKWIDRYNRLGKDEQAIVLGILVLIFFLILAAVIAHPIAFLLGVGITGTVVFIGWLLIKSKTNIAPEHILAIGAVAVALIIAAGIVLSAIDTTAGGVVITGLVGGGAIAEVIKARRSKSE